MPYSSISIKTVPEKVTRQKCKVLSQLSDSIRPYEINVCLQLDTFRKKWPQAVFYTVRSGSHYIIQSSFKKSTDSGLILGGKGIGKLTPTVQCILVGLRHVYEKVYLQIMNHAASIGYSTGELLFNW